MHRIDIHVSKISEENATELDVAIGEVCAENFCTLGFPGPDPDPTDDLRKFLVFSEDPEVLNNLGDIQETYSCSVQIIVTPLTADEWKAVQDQMNADAEAALKVLLPDKND